MQDVGPCGHDVKNDAWIAPRQPINDGSEEAGGANQRIPNPHLPGRRVGEKLDVLHALAQFVEYGHAAIKQRATAISCFDPLAVALEQAYAERMFQFRDRSRNGGLSYVEALRRLPHAARLYHRHKDVQVLQLHPSSDAIA
jgi:hypothetical protein